MAKKANKVRVGKHKHGTPNPIIQADEESILAAVDKALASSTNAQIVGANGELPLKQFFNRLSAGYPACSKRALLGT
jgi:hypothetical protein